MNNTNARPGKDFWDATVVMSESARRYHSPESIVFPFEHNPLELTVFVSSYNEEAFMRNTLETVVFALKKIGKTYEIIIIDDCSKDSSVDIIKAFIEKNPELNVVLCVNKVNKGLAQNFIEGAFMGRGKYYRLICGDNSEPVETMLKVFGMMGEADIIVPYYVSALGKSRFRRLLSQAYTGIVNLLSGNHIHYYNGLHVHLRYNVMRWRHNTRGFAFQAGLLCSLIDLGFTYKQVSCVTIEQRGGGGNALNLKNLLSVARTFMDILLNRIRPRT